MSDQPFSYYRDAYVQMKMVEKNIDPSSIQRGSSSTASYPKGKFNAFKLMDMGSAPREKRKREDNKEQREEDERKRAKQIEVRLFWTCFRGRMKLM